MSKFSLYGRETVFGFKQSAISYKLRCNRAYSLLLIAYSRQWHASNLKSYFKLI